MSKVKRVACIRRRENEKVVVVSVKVLRLIIIRTFYLILLIVAFIFLSHGLKELTIAGVGLKFAETATDCFADRIFPWEALGGES